MESIGNKYMNTRINPENHLDDEYGLTYREWLIGMIASGINIATAPAIHMEINATWIIEFADKIIENLDKEK